MNNTTTPTTMPTAATSNRLGPMPPMTISTSTAITIADDRDEGACPVTHSVRPDRGNVGSEALVDRIERSDRGAACVLAHRMVREPRLAVERSEAGDRRRVDVAIGEDPLCELG